MRWTDRQRAMLEAMGLPMWPAPGLAASMPDAEPIQERAPPAASRSPATDALSSAAARPSRIEGSAPGRPASAGVSSPLDPPRLPAVAREAVAAMDWPALREAVAACRACRLCESRTQTVFGVGSEQAQWMIVGEAPGEQEDRQGEPFVGAAGQLLDRMLAALGLTRSVDGPQPGAQRVYIANTLKCRPPRNRNPDLDEMTRCEPFLMRQIELLEPRIILAMGRFAVRSLLQSDEPVGRLRGRVHRFQGIPLVVTYHPAYLLRSLPEKAKAWEDLCLAAQAFEGDAAA